jgi:multidrug resistance efflux pump
MKVSKFFVFVGVLLAVAVVIYLTTTPRGGDIPLTGIVTGNDVIVSSQIAWRMIHLNVDEGSQVHKGDLIAEIDPAEWITARDSAVANIRILENKVNSAADTRNWTDDQTRAAVSQAEAVARSDHLQPDAKTL